MSIIVVTRDNGKMGFDADGWETQDGRMGDEGNLAVGSWTEDDELDVIAEFAKGTWLFVYVLEDEQCTPPVPLWTLPDNPLDLAEWLSPAPAEPDYTQVHDYVHEGDDEQDTVAPEPRVWKDSSELPEGVLALDSGRVLWYFRIGEEVYVNAVSNGLGTPGKSDGWIIKAPSLETGPYTEVLGETNNG